VIYVDTSVVLAQLLAEDRKPPPALWEETLISSRLTQYETWTRINAEGLARTHSDATNALLGRLAFLELSPVVLSRALEPFPVRVRTLDALHLASILYLKSQRFEVPLATYDDRITNAASRLHLALHGLDQ
jgi:uncharacterized protein